MTVLALGVSAQNLFAANYPFPPTASWTYSYGIKPANPFGASWSSDWTALANKWTAYKQAYITASGGGERVICSAQQSGDTVSEGIGYGMILSVYFNDQTTFNNLWIYEQAHLDSLGLMNWDISSGGGAIGSNSASDGDEDIAYALWLAHYQWGDGGAYNYTSLANNQTSLVVSNDIDGSLKVKPGDSFDSCRYPSYFMPSEYIIFGKQTGNTGTWNTVAGNCYSTIQAASNSASGLIADQTADTGVGSGCGTVASGTQVQYNSCRVPFYMALDYVYYGTNNSKTELGKLQSYFNGIGPGSVVDCYNVNVGGTSSNCSSNINHSAFVGPAGCALMLNSTSAASLQTYYNALMASGTTGYFDDSWNLLSCLLMQGNMPNIADPSAIYSPTSTPTSTPYAGSPTETPTQTPVASGVVFEDFEYGQLSSGYTYAAATGTLISTSSQAVNTQSAESGLYGDDITWNVVAGSGGVGSQYGGVGFNSNYANNQGVINAAGTSVVQVFFRNAGTTAFTFYLEFKEGGTTTTAVAGGHGFQWDSLPITVPTGAAWNVTTVALSKFTLDKYAAGNVTSTGAPGTTMTLASMAVCQIQTSAVWTGSFYVDNIVFLPTVAFTPTATATALVNPYQELWDDFESPLSLSKSSSTLVGCCKPYCDTFADTVTGASASWGLTATAADLVTGTYGGALTYNTGTSAGYGCGGDEISPYSNAQMYSDESGAAYLAFYIKAPLGFRYQVEFQEAGAPGALVSGADGAAWLSDMQTSAPNSAGWQYVELPIANFTEDPYDLLCNPKGILPSPCLGQGDTEQMQAIESVSFKLASGQGSGVLYFDNIAFITSWKTATASPSPTFGASFTRSPSPTVTPSSTWTVSPTATRTASPTTTDSPTSTSSASPTATSSASPTQTASPTDTASASPTETASPTGTSSATLSKTVTDSPTSTVTETSSVTGSVTNTPTNVPPDSTPTDSSTPSNTFTLTSSKTPTDTFTASPTSSSSSTSSATSTPTSSITDSVTPSVTSSVTPSVTPSMTPSVTPASPTDTPKASATETSTPASPTDTPVDSATSTSTPASPTDTPSVSSTATDTPALPTLTRTVTSSSTLTPASPTGTPKASSTTTATPASPTDTPSVTGTSSATPDATGTVSSTVVPTDIPAITSDGYSSVSGTGSGLGSYIITVTGLNFGPNAVIIFDGVTETATTGNSTTLTVTVPVVAGQIPGSVQVFNPGPGTLSVPYPLLKSTPTPVASTTQAPAGGNLVIASRPEPNPNPTVIWVNLRLPVDSVELKIYSQAFRLVGIINSNPHLQPGWNKLSLSSASGAMSGGLYYYIVSAQNNGSSLNAVKGGKFYIFGK